VLNGKVFCVEAVMTGLIAVVQINNLQNIIN